LLIGGGFSGKKYRVHPVRMLNQAIILSPASFHQGTLWPQSDKIV